LVAGLGGVEQNEAQQYLKEARNNVKLAILMARKGWSYSQASKKLRQTSGFLRKALVS
jgi:N-acetylmuramic acid 6-phosphate (MurNAc-6-P) etherase